MPTPHPALVAGTFEYIEAKIRRDAEGTTSFGFEFEWLCKWLLETAPSYRGQFDKVWLWKDWPDRWGGLSGIDLVARTRTGELWAIQAKAYRSDRPINKPEIDKFLSDSARAKFAHRLLMSTTDHIGRTARETINGQDKPVTLFLRGHFLTSEVQWPVQIGGTGARLPPWTAKPHQTTAIEAVVNGFRDHDQDRGRLIMACGTGKTLTALWITERLQSSLTLVLVPSLSLVQQNLAEWGRHAAKDFDTLIVCSDESVGRKNEDEMIQSAADLAVKPTTDPEQIRNFLQQRRKRPAVVFATYQSSDRIAAAQAGKEKPFDLVICDEAHRLAGNVDALFKTVLDSKKIKARKRLFMTATPRYIKERAKRRAAEQNLELVSMDDVHVFGPELHVLEFQQAMNAKPEPLLTDYQVVVIGVTDRDAKAWADEARLVRTAEGLRTDARTLAAQIGLAKAMQKYNQRKIITFHSSVPKAKRFVDDTQRDSLPGVITHLKRSALPSGKLWTKHISGETPAGIRATLLKEFGHLPAGTRGILSNCACLGEGIDVPALDGVAFIDPKRSTIDIIQAVGRVIRKDKDRVEKIGTIVIPVFIDESEDADHVLSQSAFEPVWQVLKALRAHDRRLADELDQLRLSLGKRSKSRSRINLPDNIHLDVPRLLLRDFEQAFYVRTVERTTDCAERLAAMWNERYGELKKFKADNGHCNVPRDKPDNPQLGNWVHHQRKAKLKSQLSPECIARLEALGFVWDRFSAAWEEMFATLMDYKVKHGHCNVSQPWPDNPSLGSWASNQRNAKKRGRLSAERVERLEAIGFVWDQLSAAWEEMFATLLDYKTTHGHCNVPKDRLDNPELGQWVSTQRRAKQLGRINRERISRLEAIGFVWDALSASWEEMFAALQDFKSKHGHCNVPKAWSDNPDLGTWVSIQRDAKKRDRLNMVRIVRLEEIGFVWNTLSAAWEEMFASLLDYKTTHGHCNVPQTWPDNPDLGPWVSDQRKAKKRGRLSTDRVERLAAIGFVWDAFSAAWEEMFAALQDYKSKHGHCNVPKTWPDNPKFANWTRTQREIKKRNRISHDRVARLDALGFVWRKKAALATSQRTTRPKT